MQKALRLQQIKAVELAKAQWMKQHGQPPPFLPAQGRNSPPLLVAVGQQPLFPFRYKDLAKIIDQTKRFR